MMSSSNSATEMKSQSSHLSVEANTEEQKNIVKLQKDKLQVDEIVSCVISPSCGAISTFIGTTRDNFESKKVIKLAYEAYEPMALKEMKNICEKIRAKWDVKHIAIFHRLGEVPVCESSVAIAISSPHRRESLQAVEFAIDTLKSSVPIWKKEIYEDQQSTWKENKEYDKLLIPKVEPLDSIQESSAEDNIVQSFKQDFDKYEVNLDQVQVKASADELNRRIESFILRKRQHVNSVNIQEFCRHRHLNSQVENSCARVDAILIRRKDSKSHVKVHRVYNPHGPQTNFSSSNESNQQNTSLNSALDERLSESERFLGIAKPVPRDIYERVKKIEDKLLYLESISPEYKNICIPQDADDDKNNPSNKRTFSTAELDTKLLELENRYAKKKK
ncbi:molybdopterin synthase catalytic subunit [Microplitis mediator]|uniref:molybdopterin synthase catalytic subunit n=1 Tax=Microplitis mediator TaxID=375433 RepID=UPI002556545F|nr:molybdopterin synthase catalytic subunit [Microplitis mediator]